MSEAGAVARLSKRTLIAAAPPRGRGPHPVSATGVTAAAGRAAVGALFERLFEDESFRTRLLRAGSDQHRRRLIAQAGFARFGLADVRSETSSLLYSGARRADGTVPPWRPRAGQTWADAPASVLEVRRRAIVFGALAASGCAEGGREQLCPSLPEKLSFVVVGAIKGGTTALDYFLGYHPSICTAAQKETHFFVRDIFFGEDTPKYEWLDFSFQHYRGESVIGESTPEYMYFATAAERMHLYNPKLKLIFLLRNPAERAYSQYRMAVARGQETRPFASVLIDDVRACGGCEGTYTAGGFYLRCIRTLLQYFPLRQMLFLRSESLRTRHRETLRKVYSFLGVEPDILPEQRTLLAGPGPPLAAADRQFLVRLYDAEVRALEEFLGWQLDDWRR